MDRGFYRRLRLRLRTRLYAQLAAGLVLLVALLGLALAAILRSLSGTYQDEVIQRSNAGLARTIAGEVKVAPSGTLDVGTISALFPYVTMVNPLVEVYVLDPAGRVLTYSGSPSPLAVQRIDLRPLLEFIDRQPMMPLRATDPRSGQSDAIFSAAPLGEPGRPAGYVYVVLGRSEAQAAAMRSSSGYVARVATVMLVAAAALAAIVGMVLFRAMTAPLQRLGDAVDRFRASGFRQLPASPPDAGDDEIARLTLAFNEMAQTLVAQLRRLEELDQSRRTGILNASHDLRTPLAALQGYLQTLLMKDDTLTPAQRREYLEVAHRHALRLHRLVDQMFALAKLDAIQSPHFEPFALGELAGDIAQSHQLRAVERGIRLAVDVGPVANLHADIAMVERLVENLLENALKFTPPGGRVQVSVRSPGGAARGAGIELVVADSGPGIAAADRDRIFEPFYRGGGTNPADSSGLGLAIVQRVVELHHGSIAVEDNPGGGARFRVLWPLHPDAAGPARLPAP